MQMAAFVDTLVVHSYYYYYLIALVGLLPSLGEKEKRASRRTRERSLIFLLLQSISARNAGNIL